MVNSSIFIPVVFGETIEVIVVQVPPPARQDERVEEVEDQLGGERGPRLRRRLPRAAYLLVQILSSYSISSGCNSFHILVAVVKALKVVECISFSSCNQAQRPVKPSYNQG